MFGKSKFAKEFNRGGIAPRAQRKRSRKCIYESTQSDLMCRIKITHQPCL